MKSAKSVLIFELKKMGFQQKGNVCFRIVDDLICLIGFEKPSSTLYVHFAIMPVYYPCNGVIIYSFGNRLNNLYADLPNLTDVVIQEQIDFWCRKLLTYLETDIFPQMQQISTAKRMCDFFVAKRRKKYCFSSKWTKKDNYFSKCFFCSPDNLLSLHVYASLYAGEYENCYSLAHQYISVLQKDNTYTQKLKDRRINEMQFIIDLILNKDFKQIEQFTTKIVEENLKLFSNK
ncbi:MAG: hypothetical protein IK118_04740 [Clostridia bacterium]|nr:hypothetical protein [Clostridia bacterium]